MKMHRAIAIIGMGLSLVACNATVKDFVNGVAPPSLQISPPALSSNSANGLKVSPGRFEADGGADVSIRANVTPTHKTMTSADVSAVVSISRIRVENQ